jgi:hypothetical protein
MELAMMNIILLQEKIIYTVGRTSNSYAQLTCMNEPNKVVRLHSNTPKAMIHLRL